MTETACTCTTACVPAGLPEGRFCRESASCAPSPPTEIAPSRNGSPRCESGSIASGGTREFCSCDTCF